MIRDLVEAAINLVRVEKRKEVEAPAKERVEERLLDLLVPSGSWEPSASSEPSTETDTNRADATARHERTREKFRAMLKAGELEDRVVELSLEQRQMPVQVLSNIGMEQMDIDFQSMFEKILPKNRKERRLKISEARSVLLEQEIEALMDRDAINEEAVSLAEKSGIVFIDEIDKICGPEEGSRNADVSRQGVQRDLLPVVEGTTVQSRYGSIRTDHMLFGRFIGRSRRT
jgi:ATP-dependent HslUV protease ATP-binding subunit HslU